MNIKSTLTNKAGQVLDVSYQDIDSVAELGEKKVSAVAAYCFYGDKFIVVFADNKGYWTPPGGGVEPGETIEDAVSREVKEETNMRVVHQRIIGVQDIFEADSIKTQTRHVCIVEPYGDFVNDPDGDITEIKLIDPDEYRQYFDWGKIGEHVMQQALKLKDVMKEY